jgi:hypothetical protein
VERLKELGGTVEQGFEEICKKLFTPEGPVFITVSSKTKPCRTKGKRAKSSSAHSSVRKPTKG